MVFTLFEKSSNIPRIMDDGSRGEPLRRSWERGCCLNSQTLCIYDVLSVNLTSDN